MLLTNHIFKELWTPLTGQYLITHELDLYPNIAHIMLNRVHSDSAFWAIISGYLARNHIGVSSKLLGGSNT